MIQAPYVIDLQIFKTLILNYKAKFHWIIFFLPLVMIGTSTFLFFSYEDYHFISIIILLIGLSVLMKRLWFMISNTLTIDSSFVTLKTGVFSTVIDRIPVEKIENFKVIKSFFGNLLNYGTIVYGNDQSYPTFKYIADPDNFLTSYKLLNDLLHDHVDISDNHMKAGASDTFMSDNIKNSNHPV